MISGRGGILGPDLSNIAGERSLRSLQESLTDSRPTFLHGISP